ncbi:hypothetical protein ES319_D08G237700v1 [Gossypium barbadense]|uniref:Uncharacterized protein n=3 Tax=Gossypium TaxID=3633 RepID=A0A5J5QK75_GOSBA|nr:hypothetical protein ES319_D08G237700v1 [Gossypium barbadense]TYG58777.1 hypothetical protein ES288_D08G249500v1 [Gossypium darwinii]TYH59830.1 hypothetical protein ES332_D08G248500v1 [Gossypium tomentosum]
MILTMSACFSIVIGLYAKEQLFHIGLMSLKKGERNGIFKICFFMGFDDIS